MFLRRKKEKHLNVCIYEKNIFEKDPNNPNVNLSCFVHLYFPEIMDLISTGKTIFKKF